MERSWLDSLIRRIKNDAGGIIYEEVRPTHEAVDWWKETASICSDEYFSALSAVALFPSRMNCMHPELHVALHMSISIRIFERPRVTQWQEVESRIKVESMNGLWRFRCQPCDPVKFHSGDAQA
jgi:hypothetical protein